MIRNGCRAVLLFVNFFSDLCSRKQHALYILALWCFLFFISYLYLNLSSSAHWSSQLELYLKTSEPFYGKMKIDTPRGMLESSVFVSNLKDLSQERHKIEIINTGISNKRAQTNLVTIQSININDNNISLVQFDKPGSVKYKDGYLSLLPNRKISYQGHVRKGHIYFSEPVYSAFSEVYIDDKYYAGVDLYSHQGAYSFKLPIGEHQSIPYLQKFDLPISKINSVAFQFDQIPNDFTLMTANLRVNGKLIYLKPKVDIDLGRIEFDNEVFTNNKRDHKVVDFAIFMVSLILSFLMVELFLLFRRRRMFSRRYWPFWGMFICSLSIISIFSLSAWPSIMQTDSMATWAQVKYLDFNTWHSHVYSFFILCLTIITDTPAALTALQTVLMSLLISYLFFNLLELGLSKFVLIAFFVVTLTSIPVLIYPSFFVRDVIYSIASVFLFVLLFFWSIRKQHLPIRYAIYIGVSIALLVGFRSEGIYLIAVVPVWLMLFVRPRVPFVGLMFISSLVVFYAQGAPLKHLLNAHEDKNYILTLLIEPLGEIISQHHQSDNYEEDRRAIDAVIWYDDLAKHYKYLEAFWSGRHLKYGVYSERDIERLKDVAIKLVIMNPHIFIKNRARVFYDSLMSITGDVNVLPAYHFSNSRRWGWHAFEDDKYRLAVFDSVPTHPALISFQYKVYERIKKTLDLGTNFFLSGRTLVWNAMFSFLLTLLIVSQWSFFPKTAAVSMLILMRMGMLFLFSPMSHFKYFFDIYLWGYFLLPMAITEFYLYRRKKAEANRLFMVQAEVNV